MVCHGVGLVRFAMLLVGGDSSLANLYITKIGFLSDHISPI